MGVLTTRIQSPLCCGVRWEGAAVVRDPPRSANPRVLRVINGKIATGAGVQFERMSLRTAAHSSDFMTSRSLVEKIPPFVGATHSAR